MVSWLPGYVPMKNLKFELPEIAGVRDWNQCLDNYEVDELSFDTTAWFGQIDLGSSETCVGEQYAYP